MRTSAITKFANSHSQRASSVLGDVGFNQIIYIPGGKALKDAGFNKPTVFETLNGGLDPDYSEPLASYDVVSKNGMQNLEQTFIDGFGEKVQEIDDYVARVVSEGQSPHKAIKNIRQGIAVAAGIVNTQTIDDTKALNIQERVLGLQTRSFFLQNTVTRLAAPQLVFTYDEFFEGQVMAKVPEGTESDLVAHTESRITQILYKNVGHIAETEEAQLLASHDTMGLRQDKTTRDMARLVNIQIAKILESAANTVTGNDWGSRSVTTGLADNRPADDVQTAVTEIEGFGFNVDYMAFHDRVWKDFNTSSENRGLGGVGPSWVDQTVPARDAQKMVNMPNYGFQGIIDQALTNTLAIIASKDAVWMGDGPTVVTNYEHDTRGYRGWMIKQWLKPVIVQENAIRQITGVSS